MVVVNPLGVTTEMLVWPWDVLVKVAFTPPTPAPVPPTMEVGGKATPKPLLLVKTRFRVKPPRRSCSNRARLVPTSRTSVKTVTVRPKELVEKAFGKTNPKGPVIAIPDGAKLKLPVREV